MHMEYTATAKYVRTSPRKVRLVARAISGKKASTALSLLSAMAKHAAEPIGKALASAIANAKQKNVSDDSLTVTSIDVMGGPVMKRWHAASRGMAHAYKKRMSHIKVILKEVREEKSV